MSTVIEVLVSLVVLVVFVWIGVFGTGGWLLARSRSLNPTEGFLLGVLLGPLGWIITALRRRRPAAIGVTSTNETAPTTSMPPTSAPAEGQRY